MPPDPQAARPPQTPQAPQALPRPPYGAAPVPPSAVPDRRWWVAPAVCTPVALLLGYVDLSASRFPAPWALGELAVAGLLAGSWLVRRTRQRRATRVALGAGACLGAFLYGKAVMVLVHVLSIAVWIHQGDG